MFPFAPISAYKHGRGIATSPKTWTKYGIQDIPTSRHQPHVAQKTNAPWSSMGAAHELLAGYILWMFDAQKKITLEIDLNCF